MERYPVPWIAASAALVSLGLHAQPQVQLSGTMELPRLLDLCAETLDIAIEYDPGTVKGTVTLRHTSPASDRDLWDLTNRQLAARGFTTVIMPGSGAYTVVQLQGAAGSARVEAGLDASDIAPEDEQAGIRSDLPPGFMTIIYEPEHLTPQQLAESLQQLLSKPGGAAQPLGTARLVISDLSPRLVQIFDAVKVLDVPSEEVRVEQVQLRFLPATQAVALAMQLALKREQAGAPKLEGEVVPSPDARGVMIIAPASSIETWRGLVQSVDQLEPVETRTYPVLTHSPRDVASLIDTTIRQAPDLPPDPRFRVVVDQLTDSLVVTATASQHQAIEALLLRLETLPAGERRQMRAIPVKHRPAADVLAIVDSLISAGAVSFEAPSQSAPPTADERSGINRAPGGLLPDAPDMPREPSERTSRPTGPHEEPELTLTLDGGTSTIIAIGPPRVLDQVASLVTSLDVRQRQVELQVLLVSLSENQTRDLGAEIRGEVGIGEIDLKLSSLFGLSGAGGGAVPTIGSASGFSGLVLSPGEFNVLIRALETLNQGRTLSMPRVVVANNQQATVDSVLQQPFTSINAGDTVSTTSFGGTQDAGTQVTLLPQVSSADHVILDYSISLSAFVGDSPAEGLPPPRQQNSLQSVVTVPDGYTIAIGGIELNTESKATSQVPFLSRIPLVGELLKDRSSTQGRQRFYAFIRPTILKSDDFADLKFLSERSRNEAEIDDGFPHLEPQVIR